MKLTILILMLVCLMSTVFSQNDTTVHYSKHGKVILLESNAAIYDHVIKKSNGRFVIKTYERKLFDKEVGKQTLEKRNDSTYLVINDKAIDVDTMVRIVSKADTGFLIKEYSNNVLISVGRSSLIMPIIKQSEWKDYYPKTGKIKSESYFKDNELLTNRNWKETGEEYVSNIYYMVDVLPEFKGGEQQLMKFLAGQIRYPSEAVEQGIQGRVVVQFIIMEDGQLDGIRILKSVYPSLDNEALRVVSLMKTKWKPGRLNEKPVRVSFVLPVVFDLGGR